MMLHELPKLRLDGIYQQRDPGRFMQRIKVPAGALSSEQAFKVAALAESFAGGRLHLTTRGSIELHDLLAEDLPPVNSGLAAVGLSGRGACGGAVRGVSCSSTFSPHYPACQALAQRLHRHFAGNPYFEGLPKKFKIGVDGSPAAGRHLIQDVGLVHAGDEAGQVLWDVWCAGGLGREPQAGFLLGNRTREGRLIPLIEGILRVYRGHGAAGKRLKHLVAAIGEAGLRDLLRQEIRELPTATVDNGLGRILPAVSGTTPQPKPLHLPVFAGEVPAATLRQLTQLAADHAGGILLLTADQDIAFFPADAAERVALRNGLAELGLADQETLPRPAFRICPGSHECRMGLAATRDVARQILTGIGDRSPAGGFAICGCPNSCSQPQLAAIGIVASRSRKDEDGGRTPLFDLYRRDGEGLGSRVAEQLPLTELLSVIERSLSNGLDHP